MPLTTALQTEACLTNMLDEAGVMTPPAPQEEEEPADPACSVLQEVHHDEENVPPFDDDLPLGADAVSLAKVPADKPKGKGKSKRKAERKAEDGGSKARRRLWSALWACGLSAIWACGFELGFDIWYGFCSSARERTGHGFATLDCKLCVSVARVWL